MKQTVEIKGIMPRTTQQGKEWSLVATDLGDMGCWSSSVKDELEKIMITKKPIDVDIQENNNGFKTIKAIWTEGYVPQVNSFNKNKEAAEVKTKSMYVSYAKDIFLNIRNDISGKKESELMDIAINLVKQAEEAFS